MRTNTEGNHLHNLDIEQLVAAFRATYPPNEKMWSVEEIAEAAGVSTKTIRRWDKQGDVAPNFYPA